MQTENTPWSYNEFLAFLMIYGAQMNLALSEEELEFVKNKTGISNIEKIKERVARSSDIEALDIIEEYRKIYLDTTEKKEKVRQDLEGLLKSDPGHSQFEKVVIHILERIIV
jgi:hypothetical protein